MKKLVSLLLAAVSLGLSGCATVLTAEQSAPQLNEVPQEKALTIAVIDKRPYVLDHDKEPKFEGIIRSSLGIPYTYNTATQQPMSQFLTDRLVAGLKKQQVAVELVETTPEEDITKVAEQMKAFNNKSMMFVLNEWKYDFHAFTDNSWYNVNVIIYDEAGKKLLSKNFQGENDVPDGGAIINEMQLIYKQRFEEIFQDTEVKSALLN